MGSRWHTLCGGVMMVCPPGIGSICIDCVLTCFAHCSRLTVGGARPTYERSRWNGRCTNDPVFEPAASEVPEEFAQVVTPGSVHPNVGLGGFPTSGA